MALVVLASTAPAIVLGQSGAGATTVPTGALRVLTCQPLPSAPPLQAPTYAREAGADGSPNGWWCDLPHATRIPSGLVAVRQDVAPQPHLYALYVTEYAEPTTVATDASSSSSKAPRVTVTVDANSAVDPDTVTRSPQPKGGRKVTLAKGVVGTLTKEGGSVAVTWSSFSKTAPKYLQAVSSVTVSGTGLSESTVLSVARHVQPS